MKLSRCFCTLVLLAPLASFAQAPPKYPALPSETPATFKPTFAGFDYERRDVMIADARRREAAHGDPGAEGRQGRADAPDAHALRREPRSPRPATAPTSAPALDGYDNAVETIVEGGYIRVVQDIRGKYGSEGDYVMNRPLAGPQNPTPVDHSTDTWDTIDWLVKNVPESNGRVGILGISYDGFLPLMALVNPHPALKVSVPMNPMVDGWMGDDWFHNGAFRQQGLSYIYDQQATRGNTMKWWSSHYDEYEMFLEAGSAGELARRRGMEQLGFWKRLARAPELRRLLARPGRRQDPGGAAAQGAGDAGPRPVGPGGHLRRARRLEGDQAEGHRERQGVPGDGPVAPRAADPRGQRARRDPLRQRHRAHLPARDPAAVPRPVPEGRRAAGRHRAGHRRSRPARTSGGGFPRGPRAARAAARRRRRRSTSAGRALGFEAPKAARPSSTEYVSDPAKPVPYIRASGPSGRLRRRSRLAALARERPARGIRPPRRR